MKKIFYKVGKTVAALSLSAFMAVSQFSAVAYAAEETELTEIVEGDAQKPAQGEPEGELKVQGQQDNVPGGIPADNLNNGENNNTGNGQNNNENNNDGDGQNNGKNNNQNGNQNDNENNNDGDGQNNSQNNNQNGNPGDNQNNNAGDDKNNNNNNNNNQAEPEYTLVENEDQLREALKKGGAIKLTQDITVQQGWVKVGSGLDGATGKDETILNLDGKTITVAQNTATFAVDAGKSLTVLNGTVTGQQETEDVGAAFECNNGSNVSLQGVTVSKLNNAVYANNAQLKIENCNFTENSNKTNGGAIFATGSTLTVLGNNTFSGNKAKVDGGAIFAERSVFLSDDATTNSFLGNTAGLKGGAISFLGFEDDLVLRQMTFTNNSSYQDSWGSGGGAIYYKGQKDLTVDSSNTFTNNYALSSGGAILFEGNELKINGNYYGNTAEKHEGGAIAIIGNFRGGNNAASLESGIFDGNKTGYDKDGNPNESYQDWGGGAIFVSDASSIVVPSKILITENEAGGFGGGLAGCSTGRVFVFGDEDNLAKVFNNKGGDKDNIHVSGEGSAKHDDHTYAAMNPVFMESGFDDYFCALNSIVDKTVFGGSKVKGSVDQSAISDEDSLYVASYVMGITSELVNGDALEQARKDALVQIINNKSYTHGGGILSNGYMIVGNPRANAISVGKSLELSALKALFTPEGEQLSLENRVYNFSVTDENGDKVLSGMNDSQGQIGFSGKISFNQKNFKAEEGSDTALYTYYLAEDEVSDSKVVKDNTRYRLEVTVHKNATAQQVGGKNFNLDKYEIQKVNIYRISGGTETLLDDSDFSFVANDEMHAALVSFLGTKGATFNNVLRPDDPLDPEGPTDPSDPSDPADSSDPVDPSDPATPSDPVVIEISDEEPVALTATPEVLGESRFADLPQVLGARRGATSDDSMGYVRVIIIIMAAAATLILASHKKRD